LRQPRAQLFTFFEPPQAGRRVTAAPADTLPQVSQFRRHNVKVAKISALQIAEAGFHTDYFEI